MKKRILLLLIVLTSICAGAQPWIEVATVKHSIDTTYVTGKNNLKVGTIGANPIRHTSEALTLKALADMVYNTHSYDSANFGTGSGYNFANHDLTVTANRTHNGSGYNMVLSNWGVFSIAGIDTSFNVAIDSGANATFYGIGNTRILAMTDTGIKGSVWITGYRMPIGAGGNAQIPVINGGLVTWSSAYVKKYKDTVLFSQSGPNTLVTYTPLVTQQLDISGFINISAVSTDVLNYIVTWTDDNGNFQQESLMGLHNGNFTNGFGSANHFMISKFTIEAQQGSPVTVFTILQTSGGTITYSAGVKITQ